MIKIIPGFPKYGADEMGNIWSYKKSVPKKLSPGWTGPKGNKYLFVNITDGKKKRSITVHRLVLLAWKGLPPVGMEACHNDGDKTNNSDSNLRWDTRKNNMADLCKTRGENWFRNMNRSTKLTEKQVRVIKYALNLGVPRVILGKMCGVTPQCISLIFVGKNWSKVQIKN